MEQPAKGEWECGSCGAITDKFVAVEGEPYHAPGVDCREVESYDPTDPRCDICGRLMEDSPNIWRDGNGVMLEADWNGETGNHVTCEEEQAAAQATMDALDAERILRRESNECDDCGRTDGTHDMTVEH